MPNTIYIYGDSHANTFIRGGKLIVDNIKDTTFKVRTVAAGRIQDDFVLKTLNGKTVLNPAFTTCMQKDKLYPIANYTSLIKKQPKAKIFLLFGTGLPHRILVNGNSIRRRYFEYYIGNENRSPHQIVPILKDMLKEELQQWQQYFFQGLNLLQEQGFDNIGILSSPPLHRDYNYILDKIPMLKLLAEERNLPPQSCFASDHFRQSLYQLSEEVIKEKALELNFQYVSSPLSTMDEQGFLKSQYCSDGLHGNEQYALEFAHHIVKEVSYE
jgi:hypothetical protein